MKIVCLVLLSFALISCSYKTIPLKSTYSDGNFEGISNKSKDQVWDNIIDFFAKNGISIRIIDRSSGLIISNETRLPWTYENNKGELVKKDAWVVIQKIIDPANKRPIAYYNVTSEWNIRIKEIDGKTMINVNLVNPSYYVSETSSYKVIFKKGSFQSTGVFEKMVYEKIK